MIVLRDNSIIFEIIVFYDFYERISYKITMIQYSKEDYSKDLFWKICMNHLTDEMAQNWDLIMSSSF